MIKVPLTIPAIVFLAVSVQAQGVLLHEDFESSSTPFEFTGLWHVEVDTTPCAAEVAPFPSASHCAWFGSPTWCNYDAGVGQGELRLANPIQLPANAPNLVLRYRRFLDTEGCADGFDLSTVAITNSAGALIDSGTDCALEPGWVDRRFDLSAHAGEQIGLSFRFNTGDNKLNDTLGWWIDDVEIVREPGSVSCTANATCPCANQANSVGAFPVSMPNEDSGGCKHSALVEGKLFGNGVPSVAADTVQLVVHDMPATGLAVYLQGSPAQPNVFGDGLVCIGGPLVRFGPHDITHGRDVYPQPGEVPLSTQCAVPVQGCTQVYQVIYRDAASYCTSSTFNCTNAYVIVWRP